jgi:hypothetical protein
MDLNTPFPTRPVFVENACNIFYLMASIVRCRQRYHARCVNVQGEQGKQSCFQGDLAALSILGLLSSWMLARFPVSSACSKPTQFTHPSHRPIVEAHISELLNLVLDTVVRNMLTMLWRCQGRTPVVLRLVSSQLVHMLMYRGQSLRLAFAVCSRVEVPKSLCITSLTLVLNSLCRVSRCLLRVGRCLCTCSSETRLTAICTASWVHPHKVT